MVRKKITLALVLFSFMITSVLAVSLNAQAAGKTKKSKVTAISVSNAETGEVTVVKGTKYKLEVAVVPANAKNKTLRYKSSNTKIATVSSTGKLEAKKIGKTKITIQSKENKKVVKTIEVTVVAKSQFTKLKSIKPNFREKIMDIGDTATLSLKFKPANASNTNVTYTSSDESVVTVSDLGVITAVGEGEAKIIIKACDASKVKVKINIEVKGQGDDSESSDESSED